MPSLSIVIPAYNEENRLPATLDAILSYIKAKGPADTEIIVVDDGSTDGTAALVQRYAPSVQLLQNPGNRGKGYAVRNGMLNACGDWVLFTDADLSAPIDELPKLMDAVLSRDADIAIGSRALDRALITVHQPLFREWSGRVFNLVMRMVTGLPFADTQCGFKLYRATTGRAVFSRQKLDGFTFDVEVLVIAYALGYKVLEVPVRWQNVEGTKVSTLQGLKSFVDLVKVRWQLATGQYNY